MTQPVATNERSVWDGRTPPLVLALSGGGFRGYFTALVLAKLEEQLGRPCYKIFNLIAGTSIGGIIAVGLAFGIPARRIAEIIAKSGPAIFPPNRRRSSRRSVAKCHGHNRLACNSKNADTFKLE
jgi:patatin-like phospholipase/acyl hydrolase